MRPEDAWHARHPVEVFAVVFRAPVERVHAMIHAHHVVPPVAPHHVANALQLVSRQDVFVLAVVERIARRRERLVEAARPAARQEHRTFVANQFALPRGVPARLPQFRQQCRPVALPGVQIQDPLADLPRRGAHQPAQSLLIARLPLRVVRAWRRPRYRGRECRRGPQANGTPSLYSNRVPKRRTCVWGGRQRGTRVRAKCGANF